MLMKNKRGDLSVVLLVFLVLFITIYSLFTFTTSSMNVEEKISNVKIIDKIYSQENLVEFYVKEAGEKAVVKSYKEIIKDSNYIGGSVILINNVDAEFTFPKKDLNDIFMVKFIDNFKKEFQKYEFDEDYLKDLKEVIISNDFEINFDGNDLNVIFINFEFEENYEKGNLRNIKYMPKMILNFDLNKIGLESFDKIYNVKDNCKSQVDIGECFNLELNNFNAVLMNKQKSSGEGYSLVTLTSNKEFLIDGNYEKIEFGFVLI